MDKRVLSAIVLFLSLLLPALSIAQVTHNLNLQDAVKLALQQNTTVKNSAIKIRIAEEQFREQREKRLPDLDFHASYARITDLTSFPDGLKNTTTIQTIPEWADLSSAAVLPIYRGGEIKYGIEKAKELQEMEHLEHEKVENDIQMKVVAAFLGIYKLMELKQLLRENILEEEDRLKEVKQLRKHGTVTTNEVLRAQLQLSDMELQLLSKQHQLASELHYLQLLLEIPAEERVTIDTAGLLDKGLHLDSRETYMTLALEKEEMRIAEKKEAITVTDVKLARSNYLPKIAWFGNYSFNYPNYMLFPPVANVYSFGKVGLEATWNISALYKNKTRMRKARLNIEREKTETEMLKNRVHDQVFRQYNDYLDILDRIPVNERAKVQAAENYRIVKVKYLHQLALITDMIDADNALLKARFNLVATKIDALMKHYELRYHAGLL